MSMTIQLDDNEVTVAKILLQFHLDNDKPEDKLYDWKPFLSLCKKAGVKVEG